MSHNHEPRCCCDIPPGDMPTWDADPTYLCPACPEHGAFALGSQHACGDCDTCACACRENCDEQCACEKS